MHLHARAIYFSLLLYYMIYRVLNVCRARGRRGAVPRILDDVVEQARGAVYNSAAVPATAALAETPTRSLGTCSRAERHGHCNCSQ